MARLLVASLVTTGPLLSLAARLLRGLAQLVGLATQRLGLTAGVVEEGRALVLGVASQRLGLPLHLGEQLGAGPFGLATLQVRLAARLGEDGLARPLGLVVQRALALLGAERLALPRRLVAQLLVLGGQALALGLAPVEAAPGHALAVDVGRPVTRGAGRLELRGRRAPLRGGRLGLAARLGDEVACLVLGGLEDPPAVLLELGEDLGGLVGGRALGLGGHDGARWLGPQRELGRVDEGREPPLDPRRGARALGDQRHADPREAQHPVGVGARRGREGPELRDDGEQGREATLVLGRPPAQRGLPLGEDDGGADLALGDRRRQRGCEHVVALGHRVDGRLGDGGAHRGPVGGRRDDRGTGRGAVADLHHGELLATEGQHPCRDRLHASGEQDAELVADRLEAVVGGVGRVDELEASAGRQAQLRGVRGLVAGSPGPLHTGAMVVLDPKNPLDVSTSRTRQVAEGLPPSSEGGTTEPGPLDASFKKSRPMTGSSVIDSARRVATTTGTNDSAAG